MRLEVSRGSRVCALFIGVVCAGCSGGAPASTTASDHGAPASAAGHAALGPAAGNSSAAGAPTPQMSTPSANSPPAVGAAGASGGAGLGSSVGAAGGIPTTGDQPVGNAPVRLDAARLLRSSCASSTVQTQLLPANVLFVIDRSGSM